MASQWVESVFKQTLPELRALPEPLAADLHSYFRGEGKNFRCELELHGTDFQKRVWQALLEIPYGKTSTYKDIGDKCGCRGYRAVGSAVGANPIAIIVPCHRVVGVSGLGGFSGGLNIKRFLLEIEGAFPLPGHA